MSSIQPSKSIVILIIYFSFVVIGSSLAILGVLFLPSEAEGSILALVTIISIFLMPIPALYLCLSYKKLIKNINAPTENIDPKSNNKLFPLRSKKVIVMFTILFSTLAIGSILAIIGIVLNPQKTLLGPLIIIVLLLAPFFGIYVCLKHIGLLKLQTKDVSEISA